MSSLFSGILGAGIYVLVGRVAGEAAYYAPLAFYAYMGFEDMVNVAEEVKDPAKNMPRAILLALFTSTILYAAVTTIAIRVLDRLNWPLAAIHHS